MLMFATVLAVCRSSLLVRDHTSSQDVVVRTSQTRCFSPGDRVQIWFSGMMTRSIPPQITAIRIRRSSSCGRCR